jgi:hypothetical protein
VILMVVHGMWLSVQRANLPPGHHGEKARVHRQEVAVDLDQLGPCSTETSPRQLLRWRGARRQSTTIRRYPRTRCTAPSRRLRKSSSSSTRPPGRDRNDVRRAQGRHAEQSNGMQGEQIGG